MKVGRAPIPTNRCFCAIHELCSVADTVTDELRIGAVAGSDLSSFSRFFYFCAASVFESSRQRDTPEGMVADGLTAVELNVGLDAGGSFHATKTPYPFNAHNSAYSSTIGDSPMMYTCELI
jgi:hypothetical protein